MCPGVYSCQFSIADFRRTKSRIDLKISGPVHWLSINKHRQFQIDATFCSSKISNWKLAAVDPGSHLIGIDFTHRYDDRDYTLKYARKLKRESTWRCVTRTCPGKLVVETTCDSRITEGDPGYYTVLKRHDQLSTCTPPLSTRIARSRVIRSSSSLTTRVAANLAGIQYTGSLNRSRKRRMKDSEAEQTDL